MRDFLGAEFYIVNFQDTNEADLKCDADPGHVFNVMMRRDQVSRGQFETLPKDRQVFSLLRALARTELRAGSTGIETGVTTGPAQKGSNRS